jgi:hypothetical protein
MNRHHRRRRHFCRNKHYPYRQYDHKQFLILNTQMDREQAQEK